MASQDFWERVWTTGSSQTENDCAIETISISSTESNNDLVETSGDEAAEKMEEVKVAPV